ncbi:CD1375 family protein [Clostridium tetani]|nr:CD1375 family protein [Clostridium tetani]SUY66164.1 Uncharacterised protein [Clostridium tetani]
MIEIYVRLIDYKEMTLEEVPEKIRNEVEERLNARKN